MNHLLQELLEMIAGVDDEEDLLVKVTEATWSGTSIELGIEASLEDHTEPGAWIIRCGQVLAHRLVSQVASSLQLVAEHPTLWQFNYPGASAFFSGVPANSEACVGALYEAHERATGSWIPFGFNRAPNLSELLRSGNGLLTRGPVPLLKVYKETLLPYGVEVNIVGEYQPQLFDGATQRSTQGVELRALLIGASYVVGIGWTAKQSNADSNDAGTDA